MSELKDDSFFIDQNESLAPLQAGNEQRFVRIPQKNGQSIRSNPISGEQTPAFMGISTPKKMTSFGKRTMTLAKLKKGSPFD